MTTKVRPKLTTAQAQETGVEATRSGPNFPSREDSPVNLGPQQWQSSTVY
jgi:hypothetical protein